MPAEAVAAIFLAVASDNAARSSPPAEPAGVRDWLFSLLSLDAIAASQARALAEAATPAELRAELRVIEGRQVNLALGAPTRRRRPKSSGEYKCARRRRQADQVGRPASRSANQPESHLPWVARAWLFLSSWTDCAPIVLPHAIYGQPSPPIQLGTRAAREIRR